MDETNKKCGLCKDMNSDKPYRLIGGSECLNDIPDGAEEYNSKLKLLKCKSGYILSENTCIPHCYSACKTRSEYSEDELSQKCLTCKERYYLEDEACKEIIESTILYKRFINLIKTFKIIKI